MIASAAAKSNLAPVIRLLQIMAMIMCPMVYIAASVKLLPPIRRFNKLNMPCLNSLILNIIQPNGVFVNTNTQPFLVAGVGIEPTYSLSERDGLPLAEPAES